MISSHHIYILDPSKVLPIKQESSLQMKCFIAVNLKKLN